MKHEFESSGSGVVDSSQNPWAKSLYDAGKFCDYSYNYTIPIAAYSELEQAIHNSCHMVQIIANEGEVYTVPELKEGAVHVQLVDVQRIVPKGKVAISVRPPKGMFMQSDALLAVQTAASLS